ncbi:acylneuraminate cytidylyltransferase family protein [Bacteroides congonensis]|uniref:acylneuraminate cytidylyltransferase family protein n=1 Tax=Bacteroides congonensis TaxID=1871006 RepID=UPI00189C4DC6|nr:acylneuraminate cytidylyltransferase family protein [Bacteroides congonensis]
MNILITICARGGSKGIPGKNIKVLAGKPLIGYSIDVAKAFAAKYEGADIALSTDSEEIIRVAAECGLVSDYKRPDYLANDTCGKIDAIKDIVLYQEQTKGKKYDYVLDLDCTSPLRTLQDLEEAFAIINTDANAVNLFSVSEPARSPYFNQVEQKENGYYAQVKQPEGLILTRQSAPKVYDLNASFYFYKREFFDLGYKGAITDRSLVYLVNHICFDLDHPIDFEIISFLIENKKLDFML